MSHKHKRSLTVSEVEQGPLQDREIREAARVDGSGMDRRYFLTALATAALTTPNLVACATRRAGAESARRWTAVQGMVDRYVAEGKVAGAGVAVSYGGTAVAYRVAGRIAFGSPERFDENSLCRIYSMTKPVTGVAAMILVEEDKLAPDSYPVQDQISAAIEADLSLESSSRASA